MMIVEIKYAQVTVLVYSSFINFRFSPEVHNDHTNMVQL